MTELVTVDIGGTNARFAIATVQDDGSIELGEVVTLGTKDYASLRSAWEAFAERIGRRCRRAAAFRSRGRSTARCSSSPTARGWYARR